MDFKEIAAVSGKPGLFRILKPTRNGVVLESLDEKKEKIIISSNTKVSILKDISMYTLSAEGNKPLADILLETKKVFGATLPVNPKSDDKALRSFFVQVVPDYDGDRVYTSDIKKLVTWYGIIYSQCPEVLEPEVEEKESAKEPVTEPQAPSATTEETSKPKKAASKKAAETPNDSAETSPAKESKAKKVKA